MPLISVVIPVHNTAKWLAKSVASVQNQTMSDLEIIIVDNLSTDGSSELCDAIAADDARIKVLHIDRAGLSVARNTGIEAASAQYVGFIDSDDTIAPEMYEILYNLIVKNAADVSMCTFRYVYESEEKNVTDSGSGSISLMTGVEVAEGILRNRIDNSSCTKLFRKSLFDSCLFPEDRFFEDQAMLYRMFAEICGKCVLIDRQYYNYLQRGGSICHTLTSNKLYHFFLADYGRVRFLQSNTDFNENVRAELLSYYADVCIGHFKSVMRSGMTDLSQDKLEEMRSCLLSLNGIELSPYARRTLWKIRWFWGFYKFNHIKSRGKTVGKNAEHSK